MSAVTLRRSESNDITEIQAIVAEQGQLQVEERFPSLPDNGDLASIIVHSYVSMTALDEQGQVCGFVALNDAPMTVPSGELEAWLTWLSSSKQSHLTISNSLWLNYVIAKPGLETVVTEQALRTAHNTLPEIDWIAYCLPKEVSSFPELESAFEEIEIPAAPSASNDAAEGSEFDEPSALYSQRLFVSSREQFIPTLKVRSALVEDYDDLIDVFESQSTSLKDQYGEFFLAELIESQNENNQALVAEVDGRAVGLMNLTTEIDLTVLQNCFELGPYNNLIGRLPTTESSIKEVESVTAPSADMTAEEVVENTSDEAVVENGDESATTADGNVVTTDEGDAAASVEGKGEGDGDAEADTNVDADTGTETAPVPATDDKEENSPASTEDTPAAPAADASAEPTEPVLLEGEGEDQPAAEAVAATDGAALDETAVDGEEMEAVDTEATEIMVDEGVEEAPALEETVEVEEGELVSMAFAVTLFCVDEMFESRSQDFLRRAFETFPDREYCIVTLPHTASESPLLSRFTSVAPAPSSTFSHVLYVLHRDALLSSDVRVSELDDVTVDVILDMVVNLANNEEITGAVKECMELLQQQGSKARQRGFVPMCNGQVLGIVVMEDRTCDKSGVEWMRSAYRLDDYVASDRHSDGKHGRILHFAINPIFTRSTRFVLREIMRQTSKTMLYYRCYPNQVIAPILSDMVQAPPRRRPMLRPNETRGDAGSGNSITGCDAAHEEDVAEKEGQTSFALHFLSRKLLSEPKMVSNCRVVVVGASDSGLSILQSLVLLPYLHFTRLTLLAVGGIPVLDDAAPADGLGGASTTGGPCGFSKRTLEQLNFPSSVRIVDARMVAIDRDGHAVMLDDDTVLPYDRLVLATGLTEASRQYVDEMEQRQQQGPDEMSVTALDHPAIHFIDGTLAKERLETSVDTVIKEDKTLKVCVYGRSLDAYSTVQGLLGRGIEGNRIVRVVPPNISSDRVEVDDTDSKENDKLKSKDSDLFGNDNYVTTTIEKRLEDSGVVRVDGTLERLTYSEEDGRLMGGAFIGTSASAEGEQAASEIPMENVAFDVLIFCHTKDVDADIFLAANESGLVYDGRLVVDGRFQTADSSIFAGGTLTKFSRRYGRTRPRHEQFNSQEVGAAVSQAILEDVDPLSVPVARDPETGNPTCPDFFKPRGTTAMLPGGLFFTHVECCPSPGRRGDEKAFVSSRELVTNPQDPLSKVSGGRGVGMRYCRLVLDEHRRVASITYLGNESVEDLNFGAIVGMQESYLNSLEHFFDKGTVTDLIKYLRGDWAVAVYHDRFRELCMNLSVSSGSTDEIQRILTTIRDAASNDETSLNDIATLRAESIGVGGAKLQYETRRTIELQMLDFLRANSSLLPMFFLPEQ